MEQYSQNLERIVEEKTQSVIEEQQKTEELLYQLRNFILNYII